jgi:hypothetical protein
MTELDLGLIDLRLIFDLATVATSSDLHPVILRVLASTGNDTTDGSQL